MDTDFRGQEVREGLLIVCSLAISCSCDLFVLVCVYKSVYGLCRRELVRIVGDVVCRCDDF